MLPLLAASEAFSKTFGLIAVFGGIGVLVGVIMMLIFVQVNGERQQNKEYLSERRNGPRV
ncbi:MAG TPA: hypothetical protein VMB51_04235 [Solirubrobacteraceae bacterium]|nr:hypothetical protein [Solirubrobacteraceae bacterium]